MSAYEQDQLVTKTSVILSKPDDWEKWLFVRKDTADRDGLWPYVDPALSEEKLRRLQDEKPQEKSVWKFKRTQVSEEEQEEIDIEDLSAEEISVYNVWVRKYERDEARWLQREKALRSFNSEIARTIDVRHLDLIVDCADPYSRLTTLKKHLCPSVGERNHQLRSRYRAVCTRPRKANLDTWLDEWVTITRLLREAKMSEVDGNRSQEDFILSIRGLDDNWASTQLQELVKKDQRGEQYTSTADLIAEFRSYYRRTFPIASSIGTFATLGVASSTEGPKPPGGSARRVICLCGESHMFKDCLYVNYSLRQPNWQPDKAVEKKFKKLRDADNVVAQVLRRTEAQLRKESSQVENKAQSVISMDDGQPVRRTTHCNAMLQTTAVADEAQPPLLTRWILDPGSNCHVTNTKGSNWTTIKKGESTDYVYAGGVLAQIEEWGEVVLSVKTPTGQSQMKLTYVAYIPGFFTSVVGLSRSRPLGVHFDSGRDCLYQGKPSNVICLLQYRDGHWLIDDEKEQAPPPALLSVYATRYPVPKPSRDDRKPLVVSQQEAHSLFGHISQKAVAQLERQVDGIKVIEQPKAPQWTECETCVQSKLHKLISRRPPREPAKRPFYRLGVDLVQLRERTERCYNGDLWMFHAVDQYSRWHEACCLPDKSSVTLKRTARRLLAKIKRQYHADVSVVRLDSDRGYSEMLQMFKELGIVVEPRAEYTEEQNGLTERAGSTIVTRGRAIRIGGDLPMELSNECCVAAVYLLNRSPTEALAWKTPYEIVHGRKPTVAHLAAIGSRAYVLNTKLMRGEKLASRTLVGQLVGYDSTNIYRVWMPTLQRVVRTRDVVFLPSESRTEEVYPSHQRLREIVNTIDIPEPQDDEQETDLALRDKDVTIYRQSDAEQAEEQLLGEAVRQQQPDAENTARWLLTPENTPGPNEQSLSSQETVELPRGWQAIAPDDEAPDRRSNNAPRREEISSQIDASNVLTSQRQRRMPGTYFTTFALAVNSTKTEKLLSEKTGTRLHRDKLPPPPRRWRDLEKHPFGHEFKDAARAEFASCKDKGCFAATAVTAATAAEAQILPLMWVFTYKFDEDGYLYKYKARLVVRGDLQDDWGDTYAATLAARVFRLLMAIAAAFGLHAYQYDVLNAFLNAPLKQLVYVRTPELFAAQMGELLELKRALYGLKDAPLLWYRHLKDTLIRLGLRPVQDVPCLFTSDQLIVFFYVDDIVVLVHPRYLSYHSQFEGQLQKAYSVRCLGELKWFLGVRVIRDWTAGAIWLVQDSFIDKVSAKFDLAQTLGRYPAVPLTDSYLLPSVEEASVERTQLYQQLVGSLAYISTFTRPDVSRAHSVLARHLQNPGQKHVAAAKHVWRYLIGTKYLAIGACSRARNNTTYISQTDDALPFYGASDAAFADDEDTRQSSYGYLFKMYGMCVDWKATRQRSVAKSTTEAELLALSVAGGEMEWWNRLFNHIKLDLDVKPVIYCDNQQTVGIVTRQEDKLRTKLRHVDTHQMWLRQEVQQQRMHVAWCPTADMPADGLTKTLVRQKHSRFVEQLGLESVERYITERSKGSNTPDLAELTGWY